MKTDTLLKKEWGTASLERPRFGPGLLLEDEDLTAGVNYTQQMLQLLLRHLFGCGIICGLQVTAEKTCNGTKVAITVAPGLALDGSGNPIHLPRPHTIEVDGGCGDLPRCIWVSICYRTKECRPREADCGDDSQSFMTRSRDGYEIQLHTSPPECGCGCWYKTPDKAETADGKSKLEEAETSDPKAEEAHDCGCGKGKKAANPQPCPPLQPDARYLCKCYWSRFTSGCSTDCDCACVLLSAVPTEPDETGKPLQPREWVRRIVRPVGLEVLCLNALSQDKGQFSLDQLAHCFGIKASEGKEASESADGGAHAEESEESGTSGGPSGTANKKSKK